MLLSEVNTPCGPLPMAEASSPTAMPAPGQDAARALPPAAWHHRKTKSRPEFQTRLMPLASLPDPNRLKKKQEQQQKKAP